MSLLKHLLITVTLVIAAILVGTLWLSVDSARNYLEGQLQAQSDSAATALALTLSQPSNQDAVMQELLISALYDTGQFTRIQLVDTAGHSLVLRQVETHEVGVSSELAPQWFNRWLPIKSGVALAQISDGWRQVGRLEIDSDASQAQDALWASFVRVLALVLVAGGIWMLAIIVLIRWLRRALREEIQVRVSGIAEQNNGQAVTPQRRVVFKELVEITQVIDAVHKRVRATAEEQGARIESLQFELHQDEVTKLANRRYFVNELRKVLQPAEGKTPGHVLLFRQRDLAAITKVMTRANVDAWLYSVGQRIQQVLATHQLQQSVLARLNGSDFVVLMPEVDGPHIAALSDEIQQVLAHLRIQLPSASFCRWAIALTDYELGEDLAAVLGRLDQALMRAESMGHEEIEFISCKDHGTETDLHRAGESQWRELLQNGLQHNKLYLSTEARAPLTPNVPLRAATLMLSSDEHGSAQTSHVSAYLFMPVAVRLGLSAVCDLRAVRLAIEWLHERTGSSLVLRVSLPSLLQPGFLDELLLLFEENQSVAAHLYIELDAYGVVAHPAEVIEFVQRVTALRVNIGLRRLVEQPSVLALLHEMKIAYVSLSASTVDSLAQNPGGAALLTTVGQLCAQLSIQLRLEGTLQNELPLTIEKALALS